MIISKDYFLFFFIFQGLYQKAEAMYQLGDFETALVFFHRGHKLRPELQEFRLGIQKAQEAINNSIGSKCSCNARISPSWLAKDFWSNPILTTGSVVD